MENIMKYKYIYLILIVILILIFSCQKPLDLEAKFTLTTLRGKELSNDAKWTQIGIGDYLILKNTGDLNLVYEATIESISGAKFSTDSGDKNNLNDNLVPGEETKIRFNITFAGKLIIKSNNVDDPDFVINIVL